jgi:hypothetical protein
VRREVDPFTHLVAFALGSYAGSALSPSRGSFKEAFALI